MEILKMNSVIDYFEYCTDPKYATHGETAVIQIVKGEYKGMIYQYNKVGFNKLSFGKMECKFDYSTIKGPDNSGGLYIVANLDQLLGDILICILEETLETGGGIMDGKNRNNDTKKPIAQ